MKQNVSEEEFRYFKQLAYRIQESFDGESDRELFLENAFCEMKEREIDFSCDKTISRFVEECLRMSSNQGILKYHIQFMDSFSENIRLICKNQYASHVVETLIHGIPKMYDSDIIKDDCKFTEQAKSWIIKLSKFAINNLEEFVTDRYAAHIIRTLLELLSGHVIEPKLMKKQKSNHPKFSISIPQPQLLPAIFGELLKNFKNKMMESPELLMVWCCDELVSPVLQALLLAVHYNSPDCTRQLVKMFLRSTRPANAAKKTTILLTDERGSHLMEQILSISSTKLRKTCFKKYFKGQLANICLHPISNFVIQRFLRSIEDKELFNSVYEELSDQLSNIIHSKKTGLLVAIAESCIRLSSCQGAFVTDLMKTLNCYETENQQKAFVICLCQLLTYCPNISLQKVALHGSLVLQHLLSFNKPIKLVRNIIGLDPKELEHLMCDSIGSHVIDAFMNSTTVGEKSKSKLVGTLKTHFVAVACDKYGSRSLDNIWKVSSVKDRVVIATELAAKDSVLQNNRFGRFTLHNYGLLHFKKHRSEWNKIQAQSTNKKRIFDCILQETENFKNKKQKIEKT